MKAGPNLRFPCVAVVADRRPLPWLPGWTTTCSAYSWTASTRSPPEARWRTWFWRRWTTRTGWQKRSAAPPRPVPPLRPWRTATGSRPAPTCGRSPSAVSGIGSPATLPLLPGPGLTVVAGCNGSGKSSFAEGFEVLLNGGLRRWASLPAVWHEGWRNLHEGETPAVRAELLLERVRERFGTCRSASTDSREPPVKL